MPENQHFRTDFIGQSWLQFGKTVIIPWAKNIGNHGESLEIDLETGETVQAPCADVPAHAFSTAIIGNVGYIYGGILSGNMVGNR